MKVKCRTLSLRKIYTLVKALWIYSSLNISSVKVEKQRAFENLPSLLSEFASKQTHQFVVCRPSTAKQGTYPQANKASQCVELDWFSFANRATWARSTPCIYSFSLCSESKVNACTSNLQKTCLLEISSAA